MVTSGPDPEDLTARARIRDAAMWHFGEYGFDAATIRGIAESAGVSSGLVRHHFGSKQALREACDEHLIKIVRRLNDEAREGLRRGSGVELSLASARAAFGPYRRYMARALVEGSAAAVFDGMVAITEEWLETADAQREDPPFGDRRTRAAVITAWALSVSILHEHVSRNVGVDIFSEAGDLVLARAMVDIYSHPILGPEDATMARDAIRRAGESTKEQRHD